MKKLLTIFAIAVVFMAGHTNKVSAQGAAVLSNNNAGGEIVRPITLTSSTSLEFGRMAVGTSGGTIVIDAASDPNRHQETGGGVTLLTSGNTASSASFTAGGTAGYHYAVTYPSSIVLNGPSGATMDITTSISTSGVLTGGSDIFYIGGSLVVADSQTPGQYSATYQVSVNYE